MDAALGVVARLGLTPLKGAAHNHPTSLEITQNGPVGDRQLTLVEEHRSRGLSVVRTVENPALLTVRAASTPEGSLCLDVPGAGTFVVPARTGAAETDAAPAVVAEYWGRPARLEPVPGPWDAALSELLRNPVRLARTQTPGAVVYAEPVTLTTTSSLRELARRGGAAGVDDERFRATVLVDTGDAAPFLEDNLVGAAVRLGEVELEVKAHVARCAVVRLLPGTARTAPDDPLRLLATDRTRGREVVFGVGAIVRTPGLLEVGASVSLA